MMGAASTTRRVSLHDGSRQEWFQAISKQGVPGTPVAPSAGERKLRTFGIMKDAPGRR